MKILTKLFELVCSVVPFIYGQLYEWGEPERNLTRRREILYIRHSESLMVYKKIKYHHDNR